MKLLIAIAPIRVMERYPDNGKLLKIYGRFLEFVCHDPWSASKHHTEAMKLGTCDNLAALHRSEGDAKSVLGTIDEKADAVIIINALGIIMTVNYAGCKMFGYEKVELEGKNVSCLMPQPFSQRHNGFLNRYVTTGTAHILNTVRGMVGLTKDHAVFPIDLAVTKISGARQDSIFLGVLRSSVSKDSRVLRVYTTALGVVLCAEERFSDYFGMDSKDLIGKKFSLLGVDVDAIER